MTYVHQHHRVFKYDQLFTKKARFIMDKKKSNKTITNKRKAHSLKSNFLLDYKTNLIIQKIALKNKKNCKRSKTKGNKNKRNKS